MDIIKNQFGERLKIIRNLKGFTQEVLAEKIGINWRQLARIEAGESFIKSDTLYKICHTLNITPSILFEFNIQDEFLMTGTNNKVHFNVIKTGNIIKLVTKNEIKNSTDNSTLKENDVDSFDNKMLSIAQKLQKDIVVNEKHNDITICTKIYSPNGEIKIQEKSANGTNSLEKLKENLTKIANDKNKIEYMNLAFNSLYDKKALEQFQYLIKGIELLQK